MDREHTHWRSAVVITAICAVAAIFAFVPGCSERFPKIRVEGQQAKTSPMLLGVCAVFMRIDNTGDGEDNLISAGVDIPGAVTEIHDIEEGKMIRRERIHIPAKSTVVLRPMSFHIMVYKMPKDTREGYEFTLRLVFEKSGEIIIPVRIVK
ncbi:MAG TPA: copper chaperone PCu(A)C [Thermodesulfovibrionales bacterium]|nr:copper chaperone PCu(A)C [Thermodesulfovibrionales bacterium]